MQGLFLGAGASYELGMPLVTELTESVRTDHTSDLVRKAGRTLQWSQGATDFFLRLLADKSIHYEAIIGAVEVLAQRNGPDQQSYEGIRSHLVDMVSRYLIGEHSARKQFTISGLNHLEGFRKYLSDGAPLRIFSLNHDVIIEEVCSFLAEPLKAGFYNNPEYCDSAFNGASIGFEFEVLTGEQMKAGDLDFFSPNECGVNLYKLHGGLDTYLFNSCHDYIRFRSAGRLAGDHIQLIIDAHNASHKLEMRDRIRCMQMLTLEDSSKEIQFFDRSLITGAFKFQGTQGSGKPGLTVMFDKFKSDIYHVKHLTCIGYSFGDLHANEIIVKWLCSSAEHKLTIVDPFIEQVPTFMLHLSSQIDLINKSFLEHLSAPNAKEQKKLELYMHRQLREYQKLKNLNRA